MVTNVCVMLGDELAKYHFGESHPFGPERYRAFLQEFNKRNLKNRVCLQSPQIATDEQLLLFHTQDYIDKVRVQSSIGEGYLDGGDTSARTGIDDAACWVVGTALHAIDKIMQGDCNKAFTPIAGLHHAHRDSAAGFCVFNDCGIAIEYLRQHYQVQRIAYVDIDAHHGDGVFYAFESDADLCFVDFHQDGNTLYPGTGFINETGKGKAVGKKLNIPLPPNSSDGLAMKFWEQAEKFIDHSKPEFILLQSGADSLLGDPITQLNLSSKFHAHVTKRLSYLAEKHCEGRLMVMGGGGYNLENIKMVWNDVIEMLVE